MNMFAGGSPNFNESTGMSSLGPQMGGQNDFMSALMRMIGSGSNNLGLQTGQNSMGMQRPPFMGGGQSGGGMGLQNSVYAGGNPNFNESSGYSAAGRFPPTIPGGFPGPVDAGRLPPTIPGGYPGPTQAKPYMPPTMPGGTPGPVRNAGPGVSLARLGMRTAY